MKHDSPAFEEQLSALVDGRLSPDEARAVRKHLASCEECRAQYDAIASARRLLRAMPAPVVPEGLLAGIQREAAAEIARGAGPSIWQRWRAPIAAVAAAAAVLLAVFTPWHAPREDAGHALAPPDAGPAVIAESPVRESEEPGVVARTELLGADDDAGAPEASVTASESQVRAAQRPASRRAAPAARVAAASAASSRPAPTPQPTTEAPEPAVVARTSGPQLAWAPPSDASCPAQSGPMLSDGDRSVMTAMAPRTTIEPEPVLAPAGPSALERELAAGVVAGMVLDQFIAQNMIESSSTLLALVTDTPSSEFGPRLAEEDGEIGAFGFSFTDAMRRALIESENQLP